MNHLWTILCATLSAILASLGSSQTLRLVPSQYPTIQAAIAACSNGDSVLVGTGVYHEAIDFLGKA